MKHKKFLTKRNTSTEIKISQKARENQKSFYYYINILFTFFILIGIIGIIIFNSNYLKNRFISFFSTTQNTYASIVIGFQVEKNFSKMAFFAPKKIFVKNTSVKSSTKTLKQSIFPPATLSLVEESKQVSKTNLSPQALNYYSLGEKTLFGEDTYSLPLNSILSKNVSTQFAGGKIKTVFVIVLENTNWESIIGNNDVAPYINERLLPQASYANNYYNPIGVHPSEPNYIWLEAGSNINLEGRKFTSDDDPSFINSTDASSHLVTLLNKKNIPWKTYLEDVSGTTCPLNSNGLYAAKHNPTIFFQDVSTNIPYCITHERPFTELAIDLNNNRVAQYNLIIPNLCDDMHDGCEPMNNHIKQGDNWLSVTLPKILNSQTYKEGGLLLITWDEGENRKDGPIGLIALSQFVKGNGYSNEIYYTHSSTLKTIEEIFALPYLRDSGNAPDLSDLFIETDPVISFSFKLLGHNNIFSPTIFAKTLSK